MSTSEIVSKKAKKIQLFNIALHYKKPKGNNGSALFGKSIRTLQTDLLQSSQFYC